MISNSVKLSKVFFEVDYCNFALGLRMKRNLGAKRSRSLLLLIFGLTKWRHFSSKCTKYELPEVIPDWWNRKNYQKY